MSLEGRCALVTGAGRGLGRRIAEALASRGVRVALVARGQAEIAAVAAEIASRGGEALAVAADVGRWSEAARAVAATTERFGSIDFLVNNAGAGWFKPFLDSSPEQIAASLDSCLAGTIWTCRAALPAMVARGRGHVVNIASDLARRPLANMAVYVGAKHGVLGFSQSLLRELKGQGIKVTTVLPGIVDTAFGGGHEGGRDPAWAMSPEWVAERIVELLEAPGTWVVDELALHPLGQEF
jgi:short-subunit dehydrogenase